MNFLEPFKKPKNSDRGSRYRNLSLVKLVQKIVDKRGRPALKEFHNNRTVFRYNGGPPLLFVDYLKELRESAAKRVWSPANASEVADKAYDLTIDKFNNLPGKKESSQQAKSGNNQHMERKGIDCRFYFSAFLERAARSFEIQPPASQIEEEARAAVLLQGLVRRHFYLSLLEAERQANPFWSRYYWTVKGETICIWLPVSLKGRKRREWLEKNIDDPDPLRSGERQRIQSIIGRKLVRERFVGFSTDRTSNEEDLMPCLDSDETSEISLADAVAGEKERNICRLRPAIRALGKRRLKKLVLLIFKEISSGQYEDGEVARDFGLSKATFSRFAGSKWISKESSIPDLWQNTADVLSTNPTFKEMAIGAGVWEQVKSTLERGEEGNEL